MTASSNAPLSGNLSERTPFARLLTGIAISLYLLLGGPAYAQGKAACPHEDIKKTAHGTTSSTRPWTAAISRRSSRSLQRREGEVT